jgi:hypothetical protein
MDAKLWEFSLPPPLLRRGFWLYVWKIRGPKSEPLFYVGSTGDVTGVAQSPFVRASLHLRENPNNNALKRCLDKRGITPEGCKEFVFAAYGPLYDYDPNDKVKNRRDTLPKVRALEQALWDAFKSDGVDLVNPRPGASQKPDPALFKKILKALG